MLQPKKTKFRKAFRRARTAGSPGAASEVSFGDFGLQVLEPGSHQRRQIEAARMTIQRHVQAFRQALDPRVPRQAGHQEAPRGSHGRRKGLARGVGVPRASPAA